MLWDYMDTLGDKYPPYFAVDNGKMRWGTKVCGVDVKAPSAILDVPAEERNVVICCMYYERYQRSLRLWVLNTASFRTDILYRHLEEWKW